MKDRSLAPVLSNVAETVNARALSKHDPQVRAFFRRRHFKACDRYELHAFTQTQLQNWCQLAAYGISTCFVLVAALVFIVYPDAVAPELRALALTYCFLIPYFLGMLANNFVMCNTCLTSLERLLVFQSEDIPNEEPDELPTDAPLVAASWPKTGNLVFD